MTADAVSGETLYVARVAGERIESRSLQGAVRVIERTLGLPDGPANTVQVDERYFTGVWQVFANRSDVYACALVRIAEL